MDIKTIKVGWSLVVGAIGGIWLTLWGDWSLAMTILMVCMGVDYLSGLVVAGVFRNSKKSENGGLDSNVGWKGLIRKGATLVVILVAHFVDMLIGTQYIRDAVVIAFTVNEILSILENCALMGVPIPAVLLKGIDILKKQSEPEQEGHVTVIAYEKYEDGDPVPGTRVDAELLDDKE